jgi:hypothetical protein
MQTRSIVTLITSSAVSLLLAACATTPAPKPAATPTPATQAAPAAPKTATANARSAAQIGMSEILDDPKKMAVLRKYAPAIADHPQISMARGMTLADVAGYAEAGLTQSLVKSIVDDINGL